MSDTNRSPQVYEMNNRVYLIGLTRHGSTTVKPNVRRLTYTKIFGYTIHTKQTYVDPNDFTTVRFDRKQALGSPKKYKEALDAIATDLTDYLVSWGIPK